VANRERGDLRLVVGDDVYTLRLTIEACCALEDMAARDLDAITVGVNRGRLTDLRWLLWAALQPYHASVYAQPNGVTALIERCGIPTIRRVLREFLILNGDDRPATKSSARSEAAPLSTWRDFYVELRAHGMPGEAFWRLSLRELWRELAAVHRQAEQARDRDVAQAWWIAALVWQKQLPALATLLGRRPPSTTDQPQSWQEMKAAMRAFTKVHNEKLTEAGVH
jgi:hypothetical protein